MSAESIARALGGRRSGSDWMAPCPAHSDHEPSLSITAGDNGKILVHCHAGCAQALVIAELRARGLWGELAGDHRGRSDQHLPLRWKVPSTQDVAERTAAALRIWSSAVSASGTLIETYLRSRGIDLPAPSAIRFHPRLKHPSGDAWPAMLALVTRGSDDAPLAIHRTFLARDGAGKAPVEPQKMMLGPCRGGAVRLAKPDGVLMIGEGIETCFAAMQATGHPAWAALSTSGLRALDLPETVRDVIVLADGDDPGEAAARDCARRCKREGRRVRIARPPQGMDFNDLLMRRAPGTEEGAQ